MERWLSDTAPVVGGPVASSHRPGRTRVQCTVAVAVVRGRVQRWHCSRSDTGYRTHGDPRGRRGGLWGRRAQARHCGSSRFLPLGQRIRNVRRSGRLALGRGVFRLHQSRIERVPSLAGVVDRRRHHVYRVIVEIMLLRSWDRNRGPSVKRAEPVIACCMRKRGGGRQGSPKVLREKPDEFSTARHDDIQRTAL